GVTTLPAPAPRVGDVIDLTADINVAAKVRLYHKGTFGGFLTLSITHQRKTRAEVKEGGRVQVTYVSDRMTDVASGVPRALAGERAGGGQGAGRQGGDVRRQRPDARADRAELTPGSGQRAPGRSGSRMLRTLGSLLLAALWLNGGRASAAEPCERPVPVFEGG